MQSAGDISRWPFAGGLQRAYFTSARQANWWIEGALGSQLTWMISTDSSLTFIYGTLDLNVFANSVARRIFSSAYSLF